MSIFDANRNYEAWLRIQCAVLESDLAAKHEAMKESAFVFLRGTFFRWAAKIEQICPDLHDAPAVLAVGDSHAENFGTWRDAEGRLVWGVNDFDEAAGMPYVFDLVRLATSARLAPSAKLAYGDAVAAILDGYRRGLASPRPTLLDEQETWMRPFVGCTDEDRDRFWSKLAALPPAALAPDHPARLAVLAGLPPGCNAERIVATQRGCGSLGRPRFAATAPWCGGHIVREAKALVPSAWDWVHQQGGPYQSRYLEIGTRAFRAPDPFLMIHQSFIVRRLAADARKVELGPDPGRRLGERLLSAMGFDLASIHAADPRASDVRADFAHRKAAWLHDAGKAAADWVEHDYQQWKAGPKPA